MNVLCDPGVIGAHLAQVNEQIVGARQQVSYYADILRRPLTPAQRNAAVPLAVTAIHTLDVLNAQRTTLVRELTNCRPLMMRLR